MRAREKFVTLFVVAYLVNKYFSTFLSEKTNFNTTDYQKA